MKRIKSVKSFLLTLYLFGIGFLFILAFIHLDSMHPYIERGHYGRIRSIIEDTFPFNEITNESDQLEYQNKMKVLTYSIIFISTKSLTKITAITAYEKVILLFAAICYILSGWSFFRQSQQCKVFFYLGILGWAVWTSIMGLIPNAILQNAKECSLALTKFMQSTGQIGESFEPVNFDMNAHQYMLWKWRIITFAICVALPAYFLFRTDMTKRK